MSNIRVAALAGFAALTYALAAPVAATAITTATIDWSSLRVTLDTGSGAQDITRTLTWVDQADYIKSSYVAGALSGLTQDSHHDISPNTGFTTSQSTTDGALFTHATTQVSPASITAGTQVDYTGKSTAYVDRYTTFYAPAAGKYTFSINYSLSGSVDGTNSQLGGGQYALNAAPYAEFDVDILQPTQSHVFLLDDAHAVNGFGSTQTTGIATFLADQDSNNNAFNLAKGTLIELDAIVQADASSFSSVSAPVPETASAYALIAGLALLAVLRRTVGLTADRRY